MMKTLGIFAGLTIASIIIGLSFRILRILFIVMSLILLLPGSSDIIAELLKWNT
ncbi:hypothetical protein [Marinococcus halotolerans]|uniref:hypothetical protein n=1 Tax=Marinococcus halotolerans TaxID=301092 RepID=UPI0003B3B9A3|nr:hypothetical protein [Marinococcus halotolerans]